ncbi:MAG: stabilization protein [Hyphomicrobium sp.]|nr:MAG: stabilization protein [Hyphomicrobium sp.]
MIVTLSPRALADLFEIRDYLLSVSPQGAESVRRAIADTIDLLADYPMIGRASDFERVRVLKVVQYPYLIYHSIRDTEVIILHIRHGARTKPETDEIR